MSGTGLASYYVEFAPSAARSLAKLERSLQRRIARRLDALASDPRPRGSEKLRGAAGRYRIRVGDYRIIYDIDDAELLILVLGVGTDATSIGGADPPRGPIPDDDD